MAHPEGGHLPPEDPPDRSGLKFGPPLEPDSRIRFSPEYEDELRRRKGKSMSDKKRQPLATLTCGLPVYDYSDDPGDRMVMRPRDPSDHRDWMKILPVSTPLFVLVHPYGEDTESDPMVRWSMPRDEAEKFGLWGTGCACCGAGAGDDKGTTWEFDTMLDEIDWYLDKWEAKK